MLVRMKPKKGEADTNWLFFKERDTARRYEDRYPRRVQRASNQG